MRHKGMIIKCLLLLALAVGTAFAQQPVNEVQLNGAAVVTGNGTNTGAQRVVISSDNTAFSVNASQATASALNATVVQATGSNLHVVLDTTSTTAVTQATAANLNATVVQATGTNLHVVCDSGCGSGGSTISLIPQTTGGLTLSHTVTAATTNATSTKGTAGQVYQVCVNNGAQYPVYLKLYNNATAPTVGTTTVVRTIVAQAGLPSCFQTEEGLAFGTGIAWAVTKNLVDTDTTAVALNDATVELAYK
jgi:hypothetical protein